MSNLLLLATAGVIVVTVVRTYQVTKDPFHPIMFLGPMLFYKFVACPWVLFASGTLEDYFAEPGCLDTVLCLNFLGVGLFSVGAAVGVPRGRLVSFTPGGWNLTPWVRQRIFRLACFLGAVAVITYFSLIFSAGGVFAVYSRAKGFFSSGSGYINELQLLLYPAIVLLAISRRGQRLRLADVALALLFASPHLIHGFLGARRGPTFTVLATLALAYCIVSLRRQTLLRVLLGLGTIGLVVIFLYSQRSEIYIGSELEFDTGSFYEKLLPTEAGPGDDFVVSAGTAIMASHTGRHYWGARYLATYVIRPIPKQLWPTKYEDTGFGWMRTQLGSGGFSQAEWNERLGWAPVGGSASGFVTDMFLEFSWGALILCYLFGRFYGYLWNKAARSKGVWTLLYVEAAMLSVYVPTQSVSAVLHRFLFMAVPTVLLWKLAIAPLLPRWRRSRSGFPPYREVGASPVTGLSGNAATRPVFRPGTRG